MDLCLLQQFQEIEEKELEEKLKKEKALDAERMGNSGRRPLTNRADSVRNTERRK